VCVVTSRSRRRWVIPKGRIEIRQTAADAAITEAWEEAGVRGTLVERPVGAYEYPKEGRRHLVTVFALLVEWESQTWPEQFERLREWVTVETAISRIEEPDLKEIIRVATQNHNMPVL
jgi:8-oxo-dGTP pyrophosphatase MutT (NUDIX family)